MYCNLIGLQVVFPSQSQLRRHEKESHLNLRPHACGICSARFDRVSQLSYHQRRIHAGERGHACQICHKVGMVYNEIKFGKHIIFSELACCDSSKFFLYLSVLLVCILYH